MTTAGVGNLTLFDIADFNMAAGSTYGFHFTSTGPGAGVIYTDGTAVGNVVATDGSLSILSGYGRSYPFISTFSPRNFNGSITYSIGAGAVPEPATWAMMIAGFGMVGAGMRRRVSKVSFTAA